MSDTIQSVRLCLAYMLGVSVAEVPMNFDDSGFHPLFDSIASCVKKFGWTTTLWPGKDCPTPDDNYLALGTRTNGAPHAVVMRAGKTAYDPHPDQAGLEKVRRLVFISRGRVDLEGRPLKDHDVMFQASTGEFPHQVGTILGAPYPCWPQDATTYRERLMYQRGVADERYAATNLRDKDALPALVKRLNVIHDEMPETTRKVVVGAVIAVLETLL